MEQLLGYIKNIGFFLILMSVVCNVLPDNGYKKYCRLFCGLVLVVLVINPFYEFLNYDGDIKDIFISNTYKSQLIELQNQLELQQDAIDNELMSRYEAALVNELSGLATEAGLYLMDVSVETAQEERSGELSLKKVTLYVTEDKQLADKAWEDKDTAGSGGVEGKKIDIGDIEIDMNINQSTYGADGSPSDDNSNTESADNGSSENPSNPRAIQLIMKVAEYLQINENQVCVKMV